MPKRLPRTRTLKGEPPLAHYDSVTGVAGPGGGTAEKPVGLVYLHAQTPDGDRGQEFSVPGDRETIRRRATVMALHLLRRVLSQSRHEGA